MNLSKRDLTSSSDKYIIYTSTKNCEYDSSHGTLCMCKQLKYIAIDLNYSWRLCQQYQGC